MRLVLLGPPGAGKGTQARLVEQRFNIPQIASGDLLRAAARLRNPIGIQARRYMDRGELVPDDVVLELVDERLRQDDAAQGFVLDGFPRTIRQAEALHVKLQARGQDVCKVVELIVPAEEIVKRISSRRTCKNCGATYHLIFDPPRNFNLCNQCNGELYQREDDAEDTVRMRLQVYVESKREVVEYYEQRGLLARVDGVGSQEQVQERIVRTIDSGGPKP